MTLEMYIGGGFGMGSLPDGCGVSGSSSWRAAKRLDVVVGFSQWSLCLWSLAWVAASSGGGDRPRLYG